MCNSGNRCFSSGGRMGRPVRQPGEASRGDPWTCVPMGPRCCGSGVPAPGRHRQVTACGGGGEKQQVSSPDLLLFASVTLTGFSPMVTSVTKCKAHRPPVILGGVEPRLFWKPAAPSRPGTVPGPRTPNCAHARSHGWGGGGEGAEKEGDVFLLQKILSNSKKIT